MKLIKIFLFLTLVMGSAGNIYAGPASAKLSALADTFIMGYTSKAGLSKTALAVFPLNCDEKLEKQRVGFAASEVMSHRFVAHGAFTVVERGEIGKLLSEQKLQASGAGGRGVGEAEGGYADRPGSGAGRYGSEAR